MASTKSLLKYFYHPIIAFTLILKGYTKLVSHHSVIGAIILAFGIMILLYFFYVMWKKYADEKLSLMIHWFEAIASLLTAWIFFSEGAKYLPYMFLLAAIGFFIGIYVHYQKLGKGVPHQGDLRNHSKRVFNRKSQL